MKKLPDAGSLAYSISIPAMAPAGPPGPRSLLYEDIADCELMLCNAPTPMDDEPDDSILEASRK